MDISTGLIVVAAVYLWFYFIDTFLKSCSHYAYIQFLNGTGLELKFLQLHWTTTALNQLIVKWTTHRKFLNIWFTVGACFSLILLPISIALLCTAIAHNLFASPNAAKLVTIEPLLPGVNLPATELGFYTCTLLVSSLVHELGHALAAAREDIAPINIGLHILFIFPVTFVKISADRMLALRPWTRLKILCAGIWHNVVVALLAYLLYISLPMLFSPLFYHGHGVTVVAMHPRSPLLGARGLSPPDDTVVRINDCNVRDEDAWFACLAQSHRPAFCIEADLVHGLDETVQLKQVENGAVECCNHNTKDNNSPGDGNGNLCFEYLDTKDTILEFPAYVCLPARPIIEQSRTYCSSHPHTCPANTFCFRPTLSDARKNLFRIKRVQRADVIYVGLAADLMHTVTVSPYVSKFRHVVSTVVPDFVAKSLHYVLIFSVGLAVLNVFPCLFMDGQHIFETVCFMVFASRLRPSRIKLVASAVSVMFTVLLSVHCLYELWKMIY